MTPLRNQASTGPHAPFLTSDPSSGPATPEDHAIQLPADFHWGVSTSAYQVEGAHDADGRGPSIWDTFAGQPGAIERGEDGRNACDHYRRWQDDIGLMRELGLTSYRFSVAWPRIQPTGRGAANAAGLAFYDRLVDGLCEAGIRPFGTLYHWDLPQALEDLGGWPHRDTADRFADYAALVVDALGDRVKDWSLFNEPFIFTSRGYLFGRYAPGRRSLTAFLASVHVVTMAHALGFRAAKSARSDVRVGSTFALAPCEPATDTPDDRWAASYADALFNHLFLQPLLGGQYPRAFLESIPTAALHARSEDDALMRTPLDFVGVNCYYRLVVSAGGRNRPDLPYFLFDIRSDTRVTGGHADFSIAPLQTTPIESAFGREEGSRTAMGWEVWPRALYDVLMELTRLYGRVPLEVCESGCAFDETPDAEGRIRDQGRIAYHERHIESVRQARQDGADVRSYHIWSLYDNFEWASGYRPRFGLVHVDFATQRRAWKDSAYWFQRLCRAARSVAANPRASS